MEAKETVKLKACVKTYCVNSCDLCELSECYVDKLAEISFEKGRQIGFGIGVEQGKLDGREEVVEWIEENTHSPFSEVADQRNTKFISAEEWQAQRKEWGIKEE